MASLSRWIGWGPCRGWNPRTTGWQSPAALSWRRSPWRGGRWRACKWKYWVRSSECGIRSRSFIKCNHFAISVIAIPKIQQRLKKIFNLGTGSSGRLDFLLELCAVLSLGCWPSENNDHLVFLNTATSFLKAVTCVEMALVKMSTNLCWHSTGREKLHICLRIEE